MRAAASSMASGMPSRRRQISATAARRRVVSEKPGCHRLGALDEELASPARVAARASSEAAPATVARRPTRRPSRLVASMLHLDASRQDRLDQIGGGIEDVLAVVEHQQHAPALERGRHASRSLRPRCWVQSDVVATASGTTRIADRGELDHPHAVGELVGQPSRRPAPRAGSCPTPPTPVSVTSRCACSSRSSSFTSASRPTNS